MSPGDTASEPSVLRRALAIAESAPVRLEGGSMGPLIASGARGRVVRCGLEELRSFDVAVYERHGRVVAHLVARVDSAGAHPASLRGAPDAPLRAEELLGRMEGLVVRRISLPIPRGIARSLVGIVRSVLATSFRKT